MKRCGLIMLVMLGTNLGVVLAAGPSDSVRLSKISKEDFLKSSLGKDPAVESFAAALGTAPSDSSDANLSPRFFLSPDQKVGLVEACLISSSKAAGLYVLSQHAKIDYYTWYDPSFNNWACEEGCNEDKDCFYEVPGLTPNAPIRRLNYRYEINLQAGQYDLQLEPGRPIKVLKKQSTDLI